MLQLHTHTHTLTLRPPTPRHLSPTAAVPFTHPSTRATHDSAMSAFVSTTLEVDSLDTWNVLLAGAEGLVVGFFWADFHVPSRRGGQMDKVVAVLAKKYPLVSFAKVEAEEVPEVTELYPINSVPTFVFLSAGSVVATLEGANPPELAKKVAEQAAAAAAAAAGAGGAGAEEKDATEARLVRLTRAARAMLFMKGTPQEPKCKFSREMIGILKEEDVRVGSFNILSDDVVRQGLKAPAFGGSPNFPKLYVEGNEDSQEFVDYCVPCRPVLREGAATGVGLDCPSLTPPP